MPATQQLLIDGQWRDAASGATHDVVNSYTREAVTTQAAAAAFPAWSALPGAERGALLSKAGDILESRGEQIAAAVSEETAGTFGWGMFNVGLAAGMFRAAGEVAQQPMEEEVASAIPGLRSG